MSRQRNIAAPLFRVAKKLKGNETGLSLVETLVALAILGSIAVVFLSGLATAAKATLIVDKRATAESLARSAMEDVKNQNYIDYSVPDHEGYEVITAPDNANYEVVIDADRIDEDIEQAQGIQKIMVTVQRDDKSVLTIEGYKVYR